MEAIFASRFSPAVDSFSAIKGPPPLPCPRPIRMSTFYGATGFAAVVMLAAQASQQSRDALKLRSSSASVGCAIVPASGLGVRGVRVVAVFAKAASVFGIVGI